MKINEIKEMVEQVIRTEYVAEDGTVFCDKEECEKYEKSALFMVSKRLKRLSKNNASHYDLVGSLGDDYASLEIFDIQTSEDLDFLKRYLLLTLLDNGESEQRAETILEENKELTAGHEVLVFWTYEHNYFWTYGNGSLDEYVEFVRKSYKKIVTPEKVTGREEE